MPRASSLPSLRLVPSVLALAAGLCVAASGSRSLAAEQDSESDEPAVTVRGRRNVERHSTRDATAASTVVDGEALHRPGATSADVLSRVPGVQVARRGSQSELATAQIRGSTSAQVPVYVAGIRINDDVTGTADLSTVPLFMIERAEVFRGNAPGGSDQLGLGGAVFFWPRLPRTTRLGAGVSAGSFGGLGGFVAGEAGGEHAAALVAIRRDQADNDYEYVNDQGQRFDRVDRVERRRNADFVAHDAWAIGRYRAGRTRVTTVLNAFEREQGITGGSVVPADAARATTRRLLAGATVHTPCSGDGSCSLELQSSYLGAGLTLRDPYVELPSLRTRLVHNQGRRTTHRAALTLALLPELELGASAQGAHESVSLDRQGALPRDADRTTLQGAVRATFRLTEAVLVHALGAVECHTTAGKVERFGQPLDLEGDTCGVAEPSGRVGAAFEIAPALTILANVGRYVRLPTLSELYGSAPLIDGNTDLRPEKGVGGDVGLRSVLNVAEGAELGLDVFAFGRIATDLIRYRRTGLGSAAPYNVGATRIVGAEGLFTFEWLHALRAETALTVLDAQETTDDPAADPTENDVLPLTPRLVAASRLEIFAEPGLGSLKQSRASLAVLHLYRASRYEDPAGQVVLPAQSTFDVEASSIHLDGRLAGRIAVRNVLDAQQLDFIGLPLPGRSAHAEVEAWW